MFSLILVLIQITIALTALGLGAIRLVEAIYELKKTPDLDTWAEIVQVVKNFFKIEKYETK